MKTLLVVTGGGPLTRRTRLHIENAPCGLTIKVARVPENVSGARVHTVVVDELEDLRHLTKAENKNEPL